MNSDNKQSQAKQKKATEKPGLTVAQQRAALDEVYATHLKVYPRLVHGLFANLRVLGVLVLLGIFYGLPWVQWEGTQLVLFDLPGRQFYIFGLTFWPQDFFYLAVLLIIAALSLFFFTALAGRVWCGYACPQTVWTEAFLWIERQIEGDRSKRMKLDQSKLTAHKFFLKFSKHFVWIVFSLYTGFTFVGFFTPLQTLWEELLIFELGPWETFWVLFYGFATYGNAGWMREQVCIYMCPYARFQSAMFDDNSLIISYDVNRGEPRGGRSRAQDHRKQGKGDCVDCSLCVQVCPTGIDIRDGLQYQCIACAACVDVCDTVMERMDYPKGLISYTTENALQGKKSKILRPRVYVYGGLLLLLTIGLLYSISQRIPLELDVIRDRNSLYRELDNGLIENVYRLRVINMDRVMHEYDLSVSGVEGILLKLDRSVIQVAAGEVLTLPVVVRIDPEYMQTTRADIEFSIRSFEDADIAQVEIGRFIAPR